MLQQTIQTRDARILKLEADLASAQKNVLSADDLAKLVQLARDTDMGIEGCSEGPKYMIRACLLEMGKAKIHPLDARETKYLRDKLNPTCP